MSDHLSGHLGSEGLSLGEGELKQSTRKRNCPIQDLLVGSVTSIPKKIGMPVCVYSAQYSLVKGERIVRFVQSTWPHADNVGDTDICLG